MAALVDALKVFQAGVVLVSHDARLVQGIEADLWVCGGGNNNDYGNSTSGAAAAAVKGAGHGGGNGQGGLRIERKGFQAYKDALVKAMELRAKALEAAAQARAEKRRLERTTKLARLAETAAKKTKKAAI